MTDITPNMVRVAVLDKEQDSYAMLDGLAIQSGQVQVVGFLTPDNDWGDQLARLRPDIVLLDGDDPGLEAIAKTEQITLANLPVACVLLWSQEDTRQIRHAMRAGAEDFLIKPLAAEQVGAVCGEVLSMVRERFPLGWGASGTRAGHYCQVTGLVCAKSGVGKTTLATNLAALIAAETDRRTALIDLQPGYAAVLLNLQPSRPLAEALQLGDELDQEVLRAFSVGHASGADLYTWQLQPDFREPYEVQPDFLQAVLQVLAAEYDHALVLFPRLAGEPLRALSIMDDVLVITTGSDLLTLRDTRIFLDTIEEAYVSKENIRIILNRYDRAHGFSQEDVERTLRRKIAATVPSDYEATSASINLGIPFVTQHPRSDLAQGVRNVASALTGATLAGPDEGRRGFAFFGRK
jgi:pilus assembly protein CpaE